MKTITLHYPDGMEESEALLYLHDVFNPKRHDYRARPPGGKRDAELLQFYDDRIGMFWVTKKGYSLVLKPKEENK